MITPDEEMEWKEYRTGILFREPKFDPNMVSVKEWSYLPGTSTRSHAHDSAQVAHVVKGKIRVKLGDEEKIIGAGSYYYTPVGVTHEIAEVFEPTIMVIVGAKASHDHA